VTDSPFDVVLEARGVVVLDGGLGTELDRRGLDLRDPLWSARALVESPGVVRDVHAAYFRAGADVAISASYQASFERFAERGIGRADGAALLRRSVELAREAAAEAGGTRMVAASIGPYGAFLGSGAEYTGAYDLDEDGPSGSTSRGSRRSPRPPPTPSRSRRSRRSSRRRRWSGPSSASRASPPG
jgi:S-methylmethionine-dependent homocysteine/selenocysteine methylase